MTTPARTATCPVCDTEQKLNQDGRIRKHKTGTWPCQGSGAPIGAARVPKPAQGWYTDPEDGTKLRRVTTILNQGSPKGEELLFWAGNTVADSALEHLPYLVKAIRTPDARAEAFDWLRKAHTRKKEDRGDLGKAVHKVIESFVLGTPWPAIPDDPEVEAIVEHFITFVDDFDVTFEASEMVVANYTIGYAGCLDYLMRSPHLYGGARLMGDTKTGGELDVKGVYPEAALQQSAYRAGEVCWLKDGTKVPMPETHHTGVVLHLRPEGYRVIPVDCGEAVFEVFSRHVFQVAEWNRDASKAVIGQPIEPPVKIPAKEVA